MVHQTIKTIILSLFILNTLAEGEVFLRTLDGNETNVGFNFTAARVDAFGFSPSNDTENKTIWSNAQYLSGDQASLGTGCATWFGMYAQFELRFPENYTAEWDNFELCFVELDARGQGETLDVFVSDSFINSTWNYTAGADIQPPMTYQDLFAANNGFKTNFKNKGNNTAANRSILCMEQGNMNGGFSNFFKDNTTEYSIGLSLVYFADNLTTACAQDPDDGSLLNLCAVEANCADSNVSIPPVMRLQGESSKPKSTTNWLLYGGIGVGVIVVVAIVIVVVLKATKGNNDDEGTGGEYLNQDIEDN